MKKFLPYILILIILTGLLSSTEKANAAIGDACTMDGTGAAGTIKKDIFGYEYCAANAVSTEPQPTTGTPTAPAGAPTSEYCWNPDTGRPVLKSKGDCTSPLQWITTQTNPSDPLNPTTTIEETQTKLTEFEKVISANSCGIGLLDHSSVWPGCFIQLSYGLFYVIPSFLLWVAAYFFNVLISMTLSSDLLGNSEFVSNAWGVVRDLSNIFFILILLYIAVKIILDLGGSEAKKMIAKVIIIALLINFSMFFTQVIIDSSNILALIFYNKLDVCINKNTETGKCRDYEAAGTEKDVAGSMVGAFDPTSLLSPTFFSNAGIQQVPGGYAPIKDSAPAGVIIGITIVAGLLMFFAVYCFFIAGFSFVGRLIELWVLIIFSPFAFMSSTVPLLDHVEYIGWDAWFKRLIKTAFMAPIFMFFLYFIFLLIQKGNPFAGVVTDNKGKINTILLVIIPALVILILLLKATEFAKKGSGKFGEVLTKAAGTVGGMATGLALGAATGGAAVLGRASVGRLGAKFANSELAKNWETHGWGGEYARRAATGIGSGSFDIRGVKVRGKTLAGATGLNVGEAQKGGFIERRKVDVERRQKRMKELEVGEDENLKQDVYSRQNDLDAAKSNTRTQADITTHTKGVTDAEKEVTLADREVAKAERELKDAIDKYGAASPQADAERTNRNAKVAIRDSKTTDLDTVKTNLKAAEKPIKDAEAALKVAQNSVIGENRGRRTTYANTTESQLGRWKNFALSGGQHSYKGAQEAANKIRAGIQEEKK